MSAHIEERVEQCRQAWNCLPPPPTPPAPTNTHTTTPPHTHHILPIAPSAILENSWISIRIDIFSNFSHECPLKISTSGGDLEPPRHVPDCPWVMFDLSWNFRGHGPLTRYKNLQVAHAPKCWGRFPRHQLQLKPLVSHPGMHHGTCVTHVPWCMSGSLTRGGGENVPGIPGICPVILRIWQEANSFTGFPIMLLTWVFPPQNAESRWFNVTSPKCSTLILVSCRTYSIITRPHSGNANNIIINNCK